MKFIHKLPVTTCPPRGSLPLVERIFSDDYFTAKCFNLWEAHLHWLSEAGWPRALEQVVLAAEDFGPPSGHEVVDLLKDFIFQTHYVNAHTGLTSSDVVDNVRLIQINESLRALDLQLTNVARHLGERFVSTGDGRLVGRTHGQPAAPLTWSQRSQAWIQPLLLASLNLPAIHAKKFGGPVGDAASLGLLFQSLGQPGVPNFPWVAVFDIEAPRNVAPIQSSDHVDEQRAVAWCAQVASQLYKIATDLRVLTMLGEVQISRPPNHAGSSSMPHKLNPYKWEKVCSICRVVAACQHEMWEVAAHNWLERSLDTSWQTKSLLNRCFLGLAKALDTMLEVDARPDYIACSDHFAESRDAISSDRDLMARIISGQNRWRAYSEMLAQASQSPSP